MRIGLITRLLWSRYGAFWEALLGHAGLETVRAGPSELGRALKDKRLEEVPGLIFGFAVAEALALAETDFLLVPELNPGEDVARGSAQDAWVASFPDALTKTVAGLPPLLVVPASLEGNLESLVVGSLQTLTRDASSARRAWERSRGLAKPPRYSEPRWTLAPSEGETVGLVGQPWLMSDGLVARLLAKGALAKRPGDGAPHNVHNSVHIVSQHQLEPAMLRQEGRRGGDRLIDTDAEVLGAARLLSRKGSVKRLMMVVDKSSGADSWLAAKVRRSLHKPIDLVYLQDIIEADDSAQAASEGLL